MVTQHVTVRPCMDILKRDAFGRTPLEIALLCVTIEQKKIIQYLYSVTKDEDPSPFLDRDGVRLLQRAIQHNFYDMALCLIKRFPALVMMKSQEDNKCALEALVRMPFAFRSGSKLTWWQDRIYSLMQVDMNSKYVQPVEATTCQSSECTKRDQENPPGSSKAIKENIMSTIDQGIRALVPYVTRVPCIIKLYKQKLMHEQAMALLKQMLVELNNRMKGQEIIVFFQENPDIIKVAVKEGIIEFVVEGLTKFRSLIWHQLPDERMIEMAIAERNEMIVSLICDIGDEIGYKMDLVSTTDDHKNTILHYAAKLAPSAQLNLISGVALQMQREVQWYKGVESIMRENDRHKRNEKGDTARYVFAHEHKDLLKKGEDWMKDTSGSCMIVAALIATVAFAAAFTVPGGNINDSTNTMNGTPVFLGETSFTLFVVADALALFTSITSVLMFLAIYTSRYAEMDFLKSLPQKLIIGFATLFISMAAILVAFGASLFIVVGGRFPWAADSNSSVYSFSYPLVCMVAITIVL